MNRSTPISSRHLLLTERGNAWVAQFDISDREIAERLVNSLTLVSHSEFERSLAELIHYRAAQVDGSVALFAVREIDPKHSYFEQAVLAGSSAVSAVGPGADLGSEARVAAMIRNIAKSDPTKFLNHPGIEQMRAAKCAALIVVDDFVGSGRRCSDFLSAIWQDTSIRSWHSLHYVCFFAVAYSATDQGLRHVQRSRCRPSLSYVRSCPTYYEMPWPRTTRQSVLKLCQKYGARTSRPGMSLGFQKTMAALVFEHGSPNNAPGILWASPTEKKPWKPLFPDRAVLPPETSAFPPEIARRDPVSVLIDAGQKRLAVSGALSRRGETGATILLVLGLVAKGIRRASALSYATGLTNIDCARIIEKCVLWGFLTPTSRITDNGLAELRHARGIDPQQSPIPPKGEETYYPKRLRRATGG